ncbi:MAG: hypothetical protein ABI140_19770 [Jatrophihabitantaceae bacterium]
MTGSALASWQAAVAAAIVAPPGTADEPVPSIERRPSSEPSGAPEPATEPERRPTAAERSGWPVTIALYRQWRVFRLMSLAPLTIALLGQHASSLIDAYLAEDRGSTSYAARDAAGFLRYLHANSDRDPWLDQMSTLELAFLAARRPASVDPQPLPGTLVRSRRAAVLQLPFDVLSLMRWASGRGEQPEPDPKPVLVAPKLTGWVRPASVAELDVWQQLTEPAAADSICLRFPGAVATMHTAGAILV